VLAAAGVNADLMDEDPFDVLGIDRTSTADDVQRARRRLAKRLHPDHGGDPAGMQAINAAADAALSVLNCPSPPAPDPLLHEAPSHDDPEPGRRRRVATDSPSFTVEALPVETFDALVIVANWMGEVLVDDAPYVLESRLVDPFECWCRLDIVPDAGASTVSITVATYDNRSLPDLDAVRDAWVANLNRLDWDHLDREQVDPSRPRPS
jgi:DnaJ-like protein